MLPRHEHFERAAHTRASLLRICDLTPFNGALYAAHATVPLGYDGATITRYAKSAIADGGVKRDSTIAFDWDRPGEPKNGGGSGRGFLRLRSIDHRLLVPDAGPPHDGFGILDHGTEGYVFVSDHFFCAAPLAVFEGYAGSQKDGSLMRFVADQPEGPQPLDSREPSPTSRDGP